jgi:hypothetical protein
MDVATLEIIVFLAICALPILLLTMPRRTLYRCQKCGHETYSHAEASGHLLLENSHKNVEL